MRYKTFNVMLAVTFLFMAVAAGGAQAATKDISLAQGWNLINTPLTPNVGAIDTVLDGIDYVSAWSWDATLNKWNVYLSGGATVTSDYAGPKGFGVLETISAGMGWWINVTTAGTLTITGAAPAATEHTLAQGWNLIGALKNEDKTVASVLSILNAESVNAKTLWSWDTAENKWNVAIPSFTSTELTDYVGTKGFAALATIPSTAGFWVNTSAGGTVDETPPTVGKAYKTTGENAYVALANVPVYKNGDPILENGEPVFTDANGNFELPSGMLDSDVITIGSGDDFTVSASKLVDGALYMFAQDQDPNKVPLMAADYEDPAAAKPKTICSLNGDACITITSMKLAKDITVAVTPYKTAISAPNVASIKSVNANYVVVGGGSLDIVDANANSVILSASDFEGNVFPKASNFLGEITGEDLANYISSSAGALELLQYKDDAWTLVGAAKLVEDTSQGKPETGEELVAGDKTYYMTVASGVQPMVGLYPFAFAFKMSYLIGSIDVTLTNGGILYKTAEGETLTTTGTEGMGVVIAESFGDKVQGAMVTADSSDDFGATNSSGTTTINYVLPPDNPIIALIIKKDGYFDATATINVVDDTAKTVTMLERPDTAAVGGNIYDTDTKTGIAGAKVTLKNPIVLDKIADDGETIQVGLDSDATYTWKIKKQGSETWVTVLTGVAENQITKEAIKAFLITGYASLSLEDKAAVGANPVGTYDLHITVSHPFGTGETATTYVESATGYLDITIDMAAFDQTASISEGTLGAVSVFGGASIGFYWATAPVTPSTTYQWQVAISSWDDADQSGLAEEGEITTLAQSDPTDVPFFSFIDAINMVQKNYLALLQVPVWKDSTQTGKSYLESGFSVTVEFTAQYEFPDADNIKTDSSFGEFDIQSADPLATLVVGKLQITPNTTMTFEAEQETDANGDYLFAFLDPDFLDPDKNGQLGLYAAADAYFPNSVPLTVETYPLLKGWITTVDLGLDPVEPPTGETEVPGWVETFEDATESAPTISAVQGDWTIDGDGSALAVQWWVLTDPETLGAADQNGVDYPLPDADGDGEADAGATATLLPAFNGTNVAWFGSKDTLTFSDTTGNTSSGGKKGKLTSPEIDLTKFSFATLDVASWFEVESVDVAQWQYDQMEIRVAVVADSYPVAIGDYTFASADDYKIVAFMNPENEASTQSAAINYSTGGNNAVPIWTKVVANLNPFAGQTIKLQLYFFSKDSLFNGFRGWAVDDVSILNQDNDLPFSLKTPNYAKAAVRSAE